MKRTTVFVDEALLRRFQAHARRHGMTFAGAVREALRAYLATAQASPGRLPAVAGRFASGRSDVAERADELLWQEPHR
ncbi:MAG: ribbon-helix-helix protein, CopG family [Gemmatimonadetes bacterium]|nr:ribbon-helix-helix protein, CopG family [Gemmatimonadota bacterium]